MPITGTFECVCAQFIYLEIITQGLFAFSANPLLTPVGVIAVPPWVDWIRCVAAKPWPDLFMVYFWYSSRVFSSDSGFLTNMQGGV